jgi:muramoyltetrapeptide carboxypeptidase
VRPERLRRGDLVGLVTPAGAIFNPAEIRDAEEALGRLGLRTRRGLHVLDRHGYLGGQDVSRAYDLMAMFRDPEVRAILPLRGGWGCARILPYLDYEAIRANPKVLCGYSDVTALLTALYTKAGIVSYHGPVATSTWNDFSAGYFRRVLFDGLPVTMPAPTPGDVVTITPGVARGRLVGGNLSVLSALVGTGYVPDTTGHLLFLEEVQEEPYRIDRMMTQLRLSGMLERASGVFFGNCRGCSPGSPAQSLSLREVLDDHLRPLGLPAFYGTAIGHVTDKFTVPVGAYAEMDAGTGTLRLLEAAVT